MKKFRIFTLMSVVALGAAFTASTRADQWDKMTTFTFSQPITVSGTVLQPGTYTFKLANLAADRHTVMIMNQRQDHVFTTVEALNAWRNDPTGKTVMTFYETPAGQPAAVKDWFYPGDNDGQEFINKNKTIELSSASQSTSSAQAAPAPAPEVAEAAPAPAPVVEEQQTVIAQNEPPAAAPPAPETPAPAPAPVLPQTGSDTPLLTLLGLLSLGAAAGLGTVVKKVG